MCRPVTRQGGVRLLKWGSAVPLPRKKIEISLKMMNMHSGTCFHTFFVFSSSVGVYTYHKADLVITWGGSYEPQDTPP